MFCWIKGTKRLAMDSSAPGSREERFVRNQKGQGCAEMEDSVEWRGRDVSGVAVGSCSSLEMKSAARLEKEDWPIWQGLTVTGQQNRVSKPPPRFLFARPRTLRAPAAFINQSSIICHLRIPEMHCFHVRRDHGIGHPLDASLCRRDWRASTLQLVRRQGGVHPLSIASHAPGSAFRTDHGQQRLACRPTNQHPLTIKKVFDTPLRPTNRVIRQQ
jgi:hypothetical protein